MPGKTLYFYPKARPLPPPRAGVGAPTQIIETREESWEKFQPLSSWLLVELTTAPGMTTGGIYLVDRARESWTDGQVLKAGPGIGFFESPAKEMLSRSVIWAEPGQVVLFCAHHYRPISEDKRIGLVRDEDLVGIYQAQADKIVPLNGWCRVRQDATTLKEGSLHLSEEWAPKAMRGTVEECGPGELKRSGPLYGCRTPPDSSLLNARVGWSPRCEVLAVGREVLESLFIQAHDLEFVDG